MSEAKGVGELGPDEQTMLIRTIEKLRQMLGSEHAPGPGQRSHHGPGVDVHGYGTRNSGSGGPDSARTWPAGTGRTSPPPWSMDSNRPSGWSARFTTYPAAPGMGVQRRVTCPPPGSATTWSGGGSSPAAAGPTPSRPLPT